MKNLVSLSALLLLLPLVGCEPKAVPVQPAQNHMSISKNQSGDGRFLWEQSECRYEVMDLTEIATENNQARIATVFFALPQTKAEVRDAAEEVYNELWDDISMSPSAKRKRVEVRVFCTKQAAADNDGFYIFMASGGGLTSRPLPRFQQTNREWKWREPEFRPEERLIELFFEYNAIRNTLQSEDEERRLLFGMAAKHGQTVTDYIRQIVPTKIWRDKQEVTETRILFEVRQYVEDFRLNDPAPHNPITEPIEIDLEQPTKRSKKFLWGGEESALTEPNKESPVRENAYEREPK